MRHNKEGSSDASEPCYQCYKLCWFPSYFVTICKDLKFVCPKSWNKLEIAQWLWRHGQSDWVIDWPWRSSYYFTGLATDVQLKILQISSFPHLKMPWDCSNSSSLGDVSCVILLSWIQINLIDVNVLSISWRGIFFKLRFVNNLLCVFCQSKNAIFLLSFVRQWTQLARPARPEERKQTGTDLKSDARRFLRVLLLVSSLNFQVVLAAWISFKKSTQWNFRCFWAWSEASNDQRRYIAGTEWYWIASALSLATGNFSIF